MAIDINKIKELAAKYEQAEARVDRLEGFIKGIMDDNRRISGIYITGPTESVPVDITSNMDAEYINAMYGIDIVDSMKYEIKDHMKFMDELIQEIKKELHL